MQDYPSLQPFEDGRYWYDILPNEATKFKEGIPAECAPLNEMGEPCPWPWDPQQLSGAPIGQYHCPYCGGMQLAGLKHLDVRDTSSHG